MLGQLDNLQQRMSATIKELNMLNIKIIAMTC